MKAWLNESSITLNHGNFAAKWQFAFWTLSQKTLLFVFMYGYAT